MDLSKSARNLTLLVLIGFIRWAFFSMLARKRLCMKKERVFPGMKAGGLKAISRSVTEGNHRE